MALIRNTKPMVMGIAGKGHAPVVTLLPGVNDIPDADWLAVSAMSGTQARIKSGEIVVDKKPAEGAPSNAPFDINSLEPAEAVARIADTFDRATLSRWLAAAKSEEVKEAISKQRGALKLTDEEKKPKIPSRGGG